MFSGSAYEHYVDWHCNQLCINTLDMLYLLLIDLSELCSTNLKDLAGSNSEMTTEKI